MVRERRDRFKDAHIGKVQKRGFRILFECSIVGQRRYSAGRHEKGRRAKFAHFKEWNETNREIWGKTLKLIKLLLLSCNKRSGP